MAEVILKHNWFAGKGRLARIYKRTEPGNTTTIPDELVEELPKTAVVKVPPAGQDLDPELLAALEKSEKEPGEQTEVEKLPGTPDGDNMAAIREIENEAAKAAKARKGKK